MIDDTISEPKVKPPRRAAPRSQKVRVVPEAVKAAADRAERPKIKARPNWESDDFIGVGMDNVDRLRVDRDKLDAITRGGYALQWCTRAVRGQQTPQDLAQMEKGGWTPVHQSDFDHLLDGDFMPKGIDEHITVDDCILMVRPVEIHAKARLMERREANGRVQTIEAQLKTTGISNVSGANHPTATRGNTINKSIERIEIPE